MAGISYFTPDDFHIGQGQRGPLLCIKDPRLTLVYFYSPKAQDCEPFTNTIISCPGNIIGAQFAMVNIGQKQLAIYKLSLGTIMPIDVVPYIVLYFNGKPYMRYSGPPDIAEIAAFIKELAVRVKDNAPVTKNMGVCPPNVGVGGQGKAKIPAYCVGKPVDDDNTFMAYGDAYG